MTELVSILLPTYNRADLLPKCIDSVISQSYNNWELIISDDASSDTTTKTSQEYVNLDDRIHYQRNARRLGLPANRNLAIASSNGQFILFVEDDLVLENDCLEILISSFKTIKEKGVKIGALAPKLILINEDRFKKGPMSFDSKLEKDNFACKFDNKTGMVYRNFSLDTGKVQEVPDVHSCSFYLKEVLQKVGGYEEKAFKGNYTCEEIDLNFRIKKMGYKLCYQPKAVTYHYKADEGGVRISSPAIANYYIIRNQIYFIIRNFGSKSLFMVPLFLANMLKIKIKQLYYNVFKKEN